MERLTDIRIHLSEALSRQVINNIADSVIASLENHPEAFTDLYQLMRIDEEKIAWRAAWACEKLCEQRPDLFMDLRMDLIKQTVNCRQQGMKRLLLSMLLQLPPTEPLSVLLLDHCLDRMFSPQESIAVQALCLKHAYRLCLQEPELMCELEAHLENAPTEYFSKAVASTRRNLLTKIRKRKLR